jgi:hypothetical protein
VENSLLRGGKENSLISLKKRKTPLQGAPGGRRGMGVFPTPKATQEEDPGRSMTIYVWSYIVTYRHRIGTTSSGF